MSDNSRRFGWSGDEDRELDELLVGLRSFSPRPGFADAVIGRVRVGSAPETAAKAAIPQVRSRRLPWVLAGGYAATSSISLVAVWALVRAGALRLETAVATVMTALVGWWQAAMGAVADVLPDAVRTLAGSLNVIPVILAVGGAWWFITMVSAYGLFQIMKSYTGRNSINAVR